MEALRALARETSFSLLGVPATVSRPGFPNIQTRIIWLTPMNDGVPTGEFRRDEPRRAMAIRRDAVPEVPKGTVVAVAEPNRSSPVLWLVDSTAVVEAEHVRVFVIPQAGT